MKTKKLLCSATIASLMIMGTQCALAQKTYVNIGIGYGMNAASQALLDTEVRTFATTITHKGVHNSLGKGLNFGANFTLLYLTL